MTNWFYVQYSQMIYYITQQLLIWINNNDGTKITRTHSLTQAHYHRYLVVQVRSRQRVVVHTTHYYEDDDAGTGPHFLPTH